MLERSTRLPGWRFAAALGICAALGFIRYIPTCLAFPSMAFGDQGWALTVDSLLDDGLIPTRDFGYYYGLLALVIDRMWFALVGRTPEAVASLIALGDLFVVIGMYRFACASGFGSRGRFLMFAAAPFAAMPVPYPSPVHAIEPALLINALAFQAAGRPGSALALTVSAIFVKSGLSGIYSGILVAFILAGYGFSPGLRVSLRRRLLTLLPAAVVAGALAIGLSILFGWQPLIHTLFPFGAAQTYADDGYGFFRDGRRFWLPRDANPFHYLLTPAGFWLAATVRLTIGAVRRVRLVRDPFNGTVVTCAILHLCFVLLLFGNHTSWLYYSAILVCGLCGVIDRGRIESRLGTEPRQRFTAVWLLSGLAVLGQLALVVFSLGHWTWWERTAPTAGLFAVPDDAAMWNQVREIGSRQRVFVLAPSGAAHLLFPEVESPRIWFLLRRSSTAGEIEAIRTQIRTADWLVIPKTDDPRGEWPEFRIEIEPFQTIGEAPSFWLLKRTSDAESGRR